MIHVFNRLPVKLQSSPILQNRFENTPKGQNINMCSEQTYISFLPQPHDWFRIQGIMFSKSFSHGEQETRMIYEIQNINDRYHFNKTAKKSELFLNHLQLCSLKDFSYTSFCERQNANEGSVLDDIYLCSVLENQ